MMVQWKKLCRQRHLWALGCYMLLAIIALKLSLRLKCDSDHLDWESRDFQSQHCRDVLYDSLKLPAKRSINCSGVTRGDQEAVLQAVLNNLEVKKQGPFTDADYLSMTRDCEHFKTKRKFIRFPLSKEESDFPIAYSMVIHEKIENFERLLRAVYAPQNIYCIHVDEKSPETFKEAVKAITSCFPNVFVASKLVRVVYASWSRVQADLNCMEDLLQSSVPWKYFLNTCGTDFPIKTNAEMVQALKMLNGKNSMESEIPTEYKRNRWKYHYEVVKDTLYISNKEKGPPPHNVTMFIGNAYIVASRDFIQHVLKNPKSQQLIEWVKDTYSPDEHLWATLQRAQWMPGSVPLHRKYDISDMTSIARLVKWQEHEGDISKGAPYTSCSGIHQRSVCIYGTGDLHWMLQSHHLLANKFDPKVDNNALQCLEEYLRHKAIYGTEL
ncbi:beta-1,3-galactosyl-O-glycosyl-glycoprotein beta-1,6-N-acetylglucosaminyltransferase 3 [Carlito syrichta]|uniref:Beta-1,3-galactosyl-O-glycosyl-glycoprotein beta-1,6-N-acetylglucosaminyltransferase 3 n=1 Tax=Carlito syrichta TaxID=1868482 RepID=A0A1U7ULK0_CARSF|nr:beta-1,3-galactosyl-O-glycosyl-glycoprotein beta-1,6-N-acetylglucosaminyltransferase 3 [Carlito syrichta]